MLTDVYQYFTDGDWCLPNGSRGIQCCQPSKSCKNWWKYQKNAKKMGWQHCILSVVIDVIGSHQWHRLTIGYYQWHQWCTRYIFGLRQQNQHRLPEDIGNQKKTRIELYSHWLRSVTECPILSQALRKMTDANKPNLTQKRTRIEAILFRKYHLYWDLTELA